MWYLVYLVFAGWVCFDASRRKNNAILWGLGTALLGPLVLPFYFADRNLKNGEMREGGRGWNVLKNFALSWTVAMLVATIFLVIRASQNPALTSGDEASQTGTAIGTAIGFAIMGALWFFPMVGALLLGLFLRKVTIVEKGPTGELARIRAFAG